MNTLYLYVNTNVSEDCLKYGIKLSEYANRAIEMDTLIKKCIVAYLAPKDCDKYYDTNYTCLKINSDNLKVYIVNDILENIKTEKKYKMCEFSDYTIGQFERPLALICTTILPENISTYNKVLDVPLLVPNSSDLFYSKSINEIIESCNFSNEELYKVLLILAEKKGKYEKAIDEANIKAYIDKKNGKLYTNVSRF